MRTPSACTSIDDIRGAIDHIDRQVVNLIGQRAEYVRAAVRFKRSQAEVQADDRVRQMLDQRRQWAQQDRLDPDLIEALYRQLVQHFVREEMIQWKQR